jgi:hypothetical protein
MSTSEIVKELEALEGVASPKSLNKTAVVRGEAIGGGKREAMGGGRRDTSSAEKMRRVEEQRAEEQRVEAQREEKQREENRRQRHNERREEEQRVEEQRVKEWRQQEQEEEEEQQQQQEEEQRVKEWREQQRREHHGSSQRSNTHTHKIVHSSTHNFTESSGVPKESIVLRSRAGASDKKVLRCVGQSSVFENETVARQEQDWGLNLNEQERDRVRAWEKTKVQAWEKAASGEAAAAAPSMENTHGLENAHAQHVQNDPQDNPQDGPQVASSHRGWQRKYRPRFTASRSPSPSPRSTSRTRDQDLAKML